MSNNTQMSAEAPTANRIIKRIDLKVSQSRAWQAISDYKEFGQWFGVNLSGPFKAGEDAIGEMESGCHAGVKWKAHIERIVPQTLFSFTWRPYAIDPAVDYSSEKPTLVEFHLEPISGGTRLTVIETGFESVMAHRRDEAFRMNDKGWTAQIENIRKHVEQG